MSNTIQLKRSSTASDTPTASDLAVGELAVNTADGKLFTKHTDNSIVEISSGSGGSSGLSNVVEDTTPQLGGDLDLNSNALKHNGSDVIEGFQHSGKNSVRLFSDGTEQLRTTGDGVQSRGGFRVTQHSTLDSTTEWLTVTSSAMSYNRGIFNLKNTGSQSELRLYCESNNAHYAALKAPAHADFSGNVDLTLPATTSTLLSTASNLADLADVSSTAPSSGEVLKWDGTAWSPAADATGSGGGNADTVDNKHIAVVSSLPASPDANTIYFIT